MEATLFMRKGGKNIVSGGSAAEDPAAAVLIEKITARTLNIIIKLRKASG